MINKIEYIIEYIHNPDIPYTDDEIDDFASPEARIITMNIGTCKGIMIRGVEDGFRSDIEPCFICNNVQLNESLTDDELGEVEGFLYYLVPDIIWDDRVNSLKCDTYKTIGEYIPLNFR